MAKVLIVDDVRSELELMKSSVASLGHEVITAADGEEAERLIQRDRPDLILLDVVLPKINGFEICRQLKQDQRLRKIPVILVSGKNAKADIFWGKKQGADEYLPKPVRHEELIQLVKRYLI
ncbi:MAG TPA: response regulator [Acidobacteriota bacterium]|jgi:twitching motility two-component system response regulator PilH